MELEEQAKCYSLGKRNHRHVVTVELIFLIVYHVLSTVLTCKLFHLTHSLSWCGNYYDLPIFYRKLEIFLKAYLPKDHIDDT